MKHLLLCILLCACTGELESRCNDFRKSLLIRKAPYTHNSYETKGLTCNTYTQSGNKRRECSWVYVRSNCRALRDAAQTERCNTQAAATLSEFCSIQCEYDKPCKVLEGCDLGKFQP